MGLRITASIGGTGAEGIEANGKPVATVGDPVVIDIDNFEEAIGEVFPGMADNYINDEFIIANLQNSIKESELYRGLNDRIDLIDGAYDLPGSVAQRVYEEAMARTDAILEEARLREEAITSESILRNESDLSLASQIDLVTAGLTTSDESLAAAIQTEVTARIEGDVAEALSREILAVEVRDLDTNIQAAYSAIIDESITRATADEAEAIMREQMISRVDNDITVAMAAISNESSARATADEAEAIQRQLLDASLSDGIYLNAAAISNESSARATADEAEAIQRDILAAKLGSAEGDIVNTAVAIENESLIRATETGALAQTTQTLQTIVDGNIASIQIQACVTDGLKAQYTVKIDNNGFMSGFGLASCASTASAFSEMYMMADQFAVINPNTDAFAISSITSDGLTATVTTVNSHTLSTLDYVVITGAYPYGYNSSFKVQTIGGTNTFTINLTTSLSSPAQLATGFDTIRYGVAAIPFIVEGGKVYLENAYIGNTLSATSTMTSGQPSWMILRNGAIYARRIVIGEDWENYVFRRDDTGAYMDNVTVSGVPSSALAATSINFNDRNDRIATAILTPTLNSTDTCIDHVLNTDGSADITFEWNWNGGDESEIDGFFVYVYDNGVATLTSQHILSTSSPVDNAYYVTAQKRAFALQGVAADHWYTFGVQAYRIVDFDINANEIITTEIVQPSSGALETIFGAYRPSSNVAFNGNVLGTINNVNASTVVSYANNGNIAFSGTEKYRVNEAPSFTTMTFGTITQAYTKNGQVVFTVPYTFQQGSVAADQLYIYFREDTLANFTSYPNLNESDTCYGTNAKTGSIGIAVKPSETATTYYIKFGIQAVRRIDSGLVGSGIVQSGLIQVKTIEVLSTDNMLYESNIANYVAEKAITDSYIKDLSVDKLTGVAIRGQGIVGKSIANIGGVITELDQELNIIYFDSVEDFSDATNFTPKPACFIGDPDNPFNYIFYYSNVDRTDNYMDVKSGGVYPEFPWSVASTGSLIIPLKPNALLDADTQEFKVFGYLTASESVDSVDYVNQICSIGHRAKVGDNALIYAGSPSYSRGSVAEFENTSISGCYTTVWMKNAGQGHILHLEASTSSNAGNYALCRITGCLGPVGATYSGEVVGGGAITAFNVSATYATINAFNTQPYNQSGGPWPTGSAQTGRSGGVAIQASGGLWDYYAVGDTLGSSLITTAATTSPGSYGPFTGAHDGLVSLTFSANPGDIIIDINAAFKKNVSDVICENDISSQPMQKSVVGVLVSWRELHPLTAGTAIPFPWEEDYSLKYNTIIFNSVGEGMINVCGEGGNIEVGDLICSSSIPGKGMKQPDDIIRNYTVAKARENVEWTEDEILNNNTKSIACSYHCG